MEKSLISQPNSTLKEKAHLMIARYKDSKGKKKEAHWVEYDADDLRALLQDESITTVKFITAAYIDEGEKKDSPTILIQLKKVNQDQVASFVYEDAPRRICPPPDGTCESGTSLER